VLVQDLLAHSFVGFRVRGFGFRIRDELGPAVIYIISRSSKCEISRDFREIFLHLPFAMMVFKKINKFFSKK
jgi:hypothetical protein